MPFTQIDTRIEGPILLEARVFGDERGFFTETYRRSDLVGLGIHEEMIQGNHSRSTRGVVRGMHFQLGRGVAKLVRCGRGSIVDVMVDLRKGSPTYGEWEAFELSDENGRLVYCPVGFAHGFCVTSDIADVFYMQDAYYDPQTERGISFRDPDVGIEWPIPADELQPSERDLAAPTLKEIAPELPFVFRG
jgi:dTDP-4-dehydrorhamnose 3,5-epimerase